MNTLSVSISLVFMANANESLVIDNSASDSISNLSLNTYEFSINTSKGEHAYLSYLHTSSLNPNHLVTQYYFP